MPANPPLGGLALIRAVARTIGGRLAERLLRTNAHPTGSPVDRHRHPWITLRPTFEYQLGVRRR